MMPTSIERNRDQSSAVLISSKAVQTPNPEAQKSIPLLGNQCTRPSIVCGSQADETSTPFKPGSVPAIKRGGQSSNPSNTAIASWSTTSAASDKSKVDDLNSPLEAMTQNHSSEISSSGEEPITTSSVFSNLPSHAFFYRIIQTSNEEMDATRAFPRSSNPFENFQPHPRRPPMHRETASLSQLGLGELLPLTPITSSFHPELSLLLHERNFGQFFLRDENQIDWENMAEYQEDLDWAAEEALPTDWQLTLNQNVLPKEDTIPATITRVVDRNSDPRIFLRPTFPPIKVSDSHAMLPNAPRHRKASAPLHIAPSRLLVAKVAFGTVPGRGEVRNGMPLPPIDGGTLPEHYTPKQSHSWDESADSAHAYSNHTMRQAELAAVAEHVLEVHPPMDNPRYGRHPIAKDSTPSQGIIALATHFGIPSYSRIDSAIPGYQSFTQPNYEEQKGYKDVRANRLAMVDPRVNRQHEPLRDSSPTKPQGRVHLNSPMYQKRWYVQAQEQGMNDKMSISIIDPDLQPYNSTQRLSAFNANRALNPNHASFSRNSGGFDSKNWRSPPAPEQHAGRRAPLPEGWVSHRRQQNPHQPQPPGYNQVCANPFPIHQERSALSTSVIRQNTARNATAQRKARRRAHTDLESRFEDAPSGVPIADLSSRSEDVATASPTALRIP